MTDNKKTQQGALYARFTCQLQKIRQKIQTSRFARKQEKHSQLSSGTGRNPPMTLEENRITGIYKWTR